MAESSSYKDLREQYEKVLVLLESAHQEIKRQGQVIEALKKQLYGSRSERLDPLQNQLDFPDVILGKAEPLAEEISAPGEGKGKQKGPRKRRTKAETRPRNLPVVIEDILVSDKVVDNPELYREIGENHTDILEAQPAQLYYKRTITKKHILKNHTGAPLQPAAPVPPVPGTMFGPYFASLIVCEKFCDSLPYYRQGQRIKRLFKYDVSRSTLNTTAFSIAKLLTPVAQAIRAEIFATDLVQIDETPIDYLSPGKGSTDQGYLWVYRDPTSKSVYFDWQLGRSLECLLDVLGYDAQTDTITYSGSLQCDGYIVYQSLAKLFKKIKLAGCLAHLRRKFYDARKEHPEICMPILLTIQRIYRIEAQIRKGSAPPGCRKVIRSARIAPLIRDLYEQINAADNPFILPASQLGKALTYARNQREKIESILSDGRFELDTNLVENAIRITKMGAKNFLFFGSAEAGKPNAVLYTLLENCKANGLSPEKYLSETIEAVNKLGPAAEQAAIAALTPARVAATKRKKDAAEQSESA